MKGKIDRRRFLKTSAVAGLGVGVIGDLHSLAENDSKSRTQSSIGYKSNRSSEGNLLIDNEEQRAWNHHELWDKSTSKGLCLTDDAIVIDDQILIENDSAGLGAINEEVWEVIKADVILRKQLYISRWPIKEATLTMMIYPVQPAEPMSGGELKIHINSYGPILYEVRHAWTSVPIPIEYLKKGKNIVEVTVNDRDTVFRTPLSLYSQYKYGSTQADKLPRYQSTRSRDGGLTWKHQKLGVSNNESGEYPIRLKLEAYQEKGYLETPFINLADTPVEGVLFFPAVIESSRLELKAEKMGNGLSIIVKFRTGFTHHPEAGGWSDWQLLEQDQDIFSTDSKNLFVQFRIEMSSTTGDKTPRLYGIKLHSQTTSVDSDSSAEIFVTEALNRPLIPSSFEFPYEDPTHPALRELRATYKFDEIVKDARTELEKIMLLRGWVAGKWDWFMRNPEKSFLTTWDARDILEGKSASGGSTKPGGYCLYYAIVLAQACHSLGIPARIVNTNFAIYGGHEVVEIWSRDYEKWIFVDPNFDTIFVNRENGIPLNVLELHEVFLDTYYPNGEIIDRDMWTYKDRDRRAEDVDPEKLPIRMEIGGRALSGRLDEYVWWKITDPPAPGYAGGYGFFNTAYIRWLPRSNWLSQPLPTPINHGRTHWGWDGYLAWTDSQTPETPEHSHFVRRQSDMYGRLFCVDFSAHAIQQDLLHIFMVTKTPGFSHFEVNNNGHKTNISENSFKWQLAPGINRLTLRSVDALSNKGSCSYLRVNYMPKK